MGSRHERQGHFWLLWMVVLFTACDSDPLGNIDASGVDAAMTSDAEASQMDAAPPRMDAGVPVGDGALPLPMPMDDAGVDAGMPMPEPVTVESFSYVGRAALDALADYPDARGPVWNYSGDGVFDPGWLLQTPSGHFGMPGSALTVASECDSGSDCDADFGLYRCAADTDCPGGESCVAMNATVTEPGALPQGLCVGHSDSFYDAMYDEIIRATEYVDIVSLSPPDGRFEAAIRNAITYVSNTGRSVRFRLLFGNITGVAVDTDAVLMRLIRDLPSDSPLAVSVGAYRVGLVSWNHAKIIAVDGQSLIQGGHNFWTDHYLTSSPVHDLTLRMEGRAAIDAHRFTSRMWVYICEGHTITGYTGMSHFPDSTLACPPEYEPMGPPLLRTGVLNISAGRLGGLGENPADDALTAMLASARTSIRMSLQDLGPIRAPGGIVPPGLVWPEDTLRELSRAIVRGIDVYISLSTPGSVPGGLNPLLANYGNGWTAEDVVRKVMDWMVMHPEEVPIGSVIRNLVCERLHVTTIRVLAGEDTYPDGSYVGNHSKFFIIDDIAFYLGSQNLYIADLSEFGQIVDDPTVTYEALTEFWNPMWEQSVSAAVSGSDAPDGCTF